MHTVLQWALVAVVIVAIFIVIFLAMQQGPDTLLAVAAVIAAGTGLVGALLHFRSPPT